jgi:putative tributyrin esterase
MKLAPRHPDRFGAAASMSGALDLDALVARRERPEEDPRLMERVSDGRPVAGTDDDLLHLVDRADRAAPPALHVTCGTEDELVGDSHAFVERCAAAGIPVATSFGAGGHDRAY